jgi:hypothetical protein
MYDLREYPVLFMTVELPNLSDILHSFPSLPQKILGYYVEIGHKH